MEDAFLKIDILLARINILVIVKDMGVTGEIHKFLGIDGQGSQKKS